MKNKGSSQEKAMSKDASTCPLSSDSKSDTGQDQESGAVQLKKQLGLFDGVSIIIGVIVGSGIFISPKGVLAQSGSTGMALIVWILSGVISSIGAMCYAELGTMITASGADYSYILASLGELPAFLFLWVALLVIVPTGNAILALTFSYYILHPVWPNCDPPEIVIRLLSAVVIALLTAVNCYNVRWGARLQGCFTVTKLLALAVVIVAGIVYLAQGNTENIQDPFEGTHYDPGKISLAFYSGLFSFAGWNYLNFVTEELRDPYKNLPRAIWLSMPLVTLVYALANLSYFIVLSKPELLESNAVAVTFADKLGVVIGYIMPFFVASSAFGALNGNIFAPSRLVFVGARQGHLPAGLAIINVDTYTPIPALVFLGVISIGMLAVEDVYILINYMSFIEALAFTGSVAGLLVLRWKKPDLPRPIKVNLALPIIFMVVCLFLLVVPVVKDPASELGVSLSVVCSGIPVYFLCIYWKNKPMWMRKIANIGAKKSIIAIASPCESPNRESEPLLGSTSSNNSSTNSKLSSLPVFTNPIMSMTQGELSEADYPGETPLTNVEAAVNHKSYS